MRIPRLLIVLACLGPLAACATKPNLPTVAQPELVSPYKIGSGDRLRIIVFGQTDLTNTYVVDQGGTIAMPLIGTVNARGRTVTDLKAAIASRLRGGFVRNPDVSVEIDRYRPVFIMGEVNAAGQYPYVAGLTVQSAIAVAGGFTPRANLHCVRVTRNIQGTLVTRQLNLNDPILPGDTLTVRQRFF